MRFPPRNQSEIRAAGFTLIELMVVVTIIGLVAGMLLPTLSKAKEKARMYQCVSNQRQLHLAWQMFAYDHNDELAHNLGAAETKQAALGLVPYDNWVNNVMSWELDADNTNSVLIAESALGRYSSGAYSHFRCPSDSVLSQIQRGAGWTTRTRSYSINAMVGHAGEFSQGSSNVNNPYYRQFLKLSDFEKPSSIFVFIEEHADSINDGYFLNRVREQEWTDLPASYHLGAASLTFADGHVESHRWLVDSTKPPSRPDAAPLPLAVSEAERADFDWLMRRTSFYAH